MEDGPLVKRAKSALMESMRTEQSRSGHPVVMADQGVNLAFLDQALLVNLQIGSEPATVTLALDISTTKLIVETSACAACNSPYDTSRSTSYSNTKDTVTIGTFSLIPDF
jgi:hypothetical protein